MLNAIGGSFKRRDLLRHLQVEKLEKLLESGGVHTRRGLNQESGLQIPGDTRWGSRFKRLDNFIVISSYIVRVLEVIEYEGSTSNERNQAKYLLSEIITFKFVFMFHLMLKVLAMSNELNNILQKRDQDIVNVVEFLNITEKRLQDMRESGWESLLDDVSSFCIMHDILIPKMNESYFPEKSKCKFSSVCYSHYLYVDIFYVVIHVQLQELNNRFDIVSSDLLLGIASLNPANSFANFDKCNPKFFNLQGISDLAKALVKVNFVETYSYVYLLMKLTLILHVTTATVERALSSMKQIKNEERNSMGDQYLNDYLVCYIERDVFTNEASRDARTYVRKWKLKEQFSILFSSRMSNKFGRFISIVSVQGDKRSTNESNEAHTTKGTNNRILISGGAANVNEGLLGRCVVGSLEKGLTEKPTLSDIRRWSVSSWKNTFGVDV
ncbi:uncharacterized protein [Nicotiana tomentosiformis]|uniref:uncharacterized protein n=1 Tax=Nicotiana tomentosiformis TaxID=4098 RepID=UPI00388C846D